MQLRQRGIEQRLVIEIDGGVSAKVDQVLLKAVARAHCWFAELINGRSASMVAIAKREGAIRHRLTRLAFLAPELVEGLSKDGNRPSSRPQSLLTSRVDLPLSWAAQKQALGCAQHV
jgi:site-specific DNA recombinase